MIKKKKSRGWILRMSFSFLSDAFPDYRDSSGTPVATALYEDFGSFSPQASATIPKKAVSDDSDLLAENFTGYNLPYKDAKGYPRAFDASDDYFRLVHEVNKSSDPLFEEPVKPVDESHQNAETQCMDVAKHIDSCQECRIRLETIFRKLLKKPPVEDKKEKRQTSSDMLMLLIFGIFIVFVLDIFVRLGQYFKR